VLLSPICPVELHPEQADWDGYSGVGDYRSANGNTEEVVRTAHGIRDGVFDSLPSNTLETGEIFDCVVVGGGLSGLAAAMFFKGQAGPGRTCLVLENHPIFGGEARRNEFIVDGHRLIAPQGSNEFAVPFPGSLVDQFYRQIGLDWREFKYQSWSGPTPALALSRTHWSHFTSMPPTFGFFFGAKFGLREGMWLTDPWGKKLEGAPFTARVRSDLLKWREVGNETEEPFKFEGDDASRQLDSITMEDLLMRQGLSRETIRIFLAPMVASSYGLGPDALSGFTDYASFRSMNEDPENGENSFPGGNAGMARHIVRALVPNAIPGPAELEAICRSPINFSSLDRPESPVRIRLQSTVVRVEHEREPRRSDFVWVTYTRDDKVYRLKGRCVIMAGGGWATRRIVRDLPPRHREAYDQFLYSAVLVANVALRNWRFLYKLGISGGRWFEGFGYWTEVRKIATFGADTQTIGPDSPTVLTLYVPLFYPGLPAADQGHKGRLELLATPFSDYERRIRDQLSEMFGRSGFDPERDIAGIILNRWGHAFVNPGPGFFFGKEDQPSPRHVLRNEPFGRISFAHVDLAGTSQHQYSIIEANRAAVQVLATVGYT
jgi:spermidine dehydrogenase